MPDKIPLFRCFFVTIRISRAFYMIEVVKDRYLQGCLVLYAAEMCESFLLEFFKGSVELFRRNEK